MAETKLKPQAGATLSSKYITATRDLTAATGDVSYTGVGFTPTSIQAFSAIDGGNLGRSNGFADSAKAQGLTCFDGTNNRVGSDVALLGVFTSSTACQFAVLKTYDADGFTLTWTKTASPTGTAQLKFLCKR